MKESCRMDRSFAATKLRIPSLEMHGNNGTRTSKVLFPRIGSRRLSRWRDPPITFKATDRKGCESFWFRNLESMLSIPEPELQRSRAGPSDR